MATAIGRNRRCSLPVSAIHTFDGTVGIAVTVATIASVPITGTLWLDQRRGAEGQVMPNVGGFENGSTARFALLIGPLLGDE